MTAVRIIRIAIYFVTRGSQCRAYLPPVWTMPNCQIGYDYDLWGVTAVWKCGARELELVISFTTIEWNLEASVCFEISRRPYSIVIGIHVSVRNSACPLVRDK